MIEKMIMEVKQYLPLKIEETTWDGTIFQMHGSKWNFVTLSAWRVSTKDKINFGCYDKNSSQLIKDLENIEILDLNFQNLMKIDPVFLLSNGQKVEIFSTDTYEPWTFGVEELGVFIAT